MDGWIQFIGFPIVHSDSRQYIKADISNLPDSTEVPIVALYAFTGDEEVIN